MKKRSIVTLLLLVLTMVLTTCVFAGCADSSNETSSSSNVSSSETSSDNGASDGKDDSSDNSSSNGADEGAYYTFKAYARSFTGYGSDGGAVRDANGEDITFLELQLAEGTKYTVQAHCYPNYLFLGWYTDGDDALISTENVYTFTIDKSMTIYACYAYEREVLGIRLEADGLAGFTYQNGEPTTTLVTKDSQKAPKPDSVDVVALLANGTEESYGSKSSHAYFEESITIDYGGLDYSKVGTYTITYTFKKNEAIKETLTVQVVESGNKLIVNTYDKNLKFRYNVSGDIMTYEDVLPEGRPVTLTAEAKEGYAFTGWYNANTETLVSDDLVYCFTMPNKEVNLYGTYASANTTLNCYVPYSCGELVDGFGNAYIWSGSITKTFKLGSQIHLVVRERSTHDFKGWYEETDGTPVLLTTERTLDFTLNENRYVCAEFKEKIKSIEVDADTLSKEGFIDGQIACAIDDEPIDFGNYKVNGKGVTGTFGELSAEDYVIDDGGVDFHTAGKYTITYTYKYNTSIKTYLKVTVIDPNVAKVEYRKAYSYLDHDYNGKASFISLRDITVNGTSLYAFRADSDVWNKLSYTWTDKATGNVVDTKDGDITINGNVVRDFGPLNDKIVIGNELAGPVAAGSYTFELKYEGKSVLTQDATIKGAAFKKITTAEEFKSNEGSSWLNFELYFYTIVSIVDGQYYVMQTPSIGTENVETEARLVVPDADGHITVGDGKDFVFANVRYTIYDYSGNTEFLTGYYGSYIIYSSANSTVGNFGSPYIYRTGYTSVSGGHIYRAYGEKETYGNKTEFAADGSATIYSPDNGETVNDRLRLVKDGDKYVFTSVPADTDTRASYSVFIYQSVSTTR